MSQKRSYWRPNSGQTPQEFKQLFLNEWPKDRMRMWFTDDGIPVHEDFFELWWFMGFDDWKDHARSLVNEGWMSRDDSDRALESLVWLMKHSVQRLQGYGWTFEHDRCLEFLDLVCHV